MRYWRLTNSDGKVWLMPREDCRTALMLYQPSGWRGVWLKRLLPCWAYLPEACSPFPIVDYETERGIRSVMERIFGGRTLRYASFEGTPCIHQKRTIQVFDGTEILAYCKVSSDERVGRVLERERSLLELLRAREIAHVPRCLYAGRYDDSNHYLLVMSTEKSRKAQVVHRWGALHEAFVDELQRKTYRSVAYEECDLCQCIALLRKRWKDLPPCLDKETLEDAMQWTEGRLSGTQVECALMHGDFTPWNTFVEQNHLFVFDWEYAYMTAPLGMDRYHFHTQTAFFERHEDAEAVMRYADSPEGSWMDRERLLYYILMITARFVGREPMDQVMGDTTLMAYWNLLLQKCLNRLTGHNQR